MSEKFLILAKKGIENKIKREKIEEDYARCSFEEKYKSTYEPSIEKIVSEVISRGPASYRRSFFRKYAVYCFIDNFDIPFEAYEKYFRDNKFDSAYRPKTSGFIRMPSNHLIYFEMEIPKSKE